MQTGRSDVWPRRSFALDAAFRWIALEQAGRQPRVGTTANYAQLVDPLLLMLAEEDENPCGQQERASSHWLVFVVLAYTDSVQIIARFGLDAHITVGVDPDADAHTLGARMINLLDRDARHFVTW